MSETLNPHIPNNTPSSSEWDSLKDVPQNTDTAEPTESKPSTEWYGYRDGHLEPLPAQNVLLDDPLPDEPHMERVINHCTDSDMVDYLLDKLSYEREEAKPDNPSEKEMLSDTIDVLRDMSNLLITPEFREASGTEVLNHLMETYTDRMKFYTDRHRQQYANEAARQLAAAADLMGTYDNMKAQHETSSLRFVKDDDKTETQETKPEADIVQFPAVDDPGELRGDVIS